MKAQLVNEYIKEETGNTVYVYAISGKPDEVRKYTESVEAEGRKVVIDEQNRPLFFTTNFATAEGEFRISKRGNWYVDSSGVKRALQMAKSANIDPTELILRLAGVKSVTPQQAPQVAEAEGLDEV